MSAKGHVRRATSEDARGIARVRVRGWQAGYAGVIPQDYLDAMDIEANAERTRQWRWDRPGALHWVYVSDGDIVGWTSTFFPARGDDLEDTAGEIVACYALPEVWGTGVGYRMMEEAERCLRDQGAAAAILWVLAKNPRAQGFYRRQGFALDGARKPETFVPEALLESVRMRKDL